MIKCEMVKYKMIRDTNSLTDEKKSKPINHDHFRLRFEKQLKIRKLGKIIIARTQWER